MRIRGRSASENLVGAGAEHAERDRHFERRKQIGQETGNADFTLAKDFHWTESRYFQFRWELYNALNHQSLGLPNTNWCLPPNPDGSVDAVHQFGCQFGKITNVQTDPRSMEFGLKFYW